MLKQHRKKWATAVSAFMDEISMVAPAQLPQADVRIRQAKNNPHLPFGALGMVMSGDFLQLQPVDAHSFAHPMKEGVWKDITDPLPSHKKFLMNSFQSIFDYYDRWSLDEFLSHSYFKYV